MSISYVSSLFSLPTFVYFVSLNCVVDSGEETLSHKSGKGDWDLSFPVPFPWTKRQTKTDSPLNLCICSKEVWRSIAADIIRFVEFSHCSFLIIYCSALISFSGYWNHVCIHVHIHTCWVFITQWIIWGIYHFRDYMCSKLCLMFTTNQTNVEWINQQSYRLRSWRKVRLESLLNQTWTSKELNMFCCCSTAS